MNRCTIGSLFSGIGGLDLGLELAGFGPTLYHVEQNPFARWVLATRWPHAMRFDDVRTVGARNLPEADVIAGGFPCQGFSQAGKRKGFCDPRSALWAEMRRVVAEMRPRAVVVENVVEMVRSGADKPVASDLEALGYEVDTPWVIDAADLGAPHHRLRAFIVAVRPGPAIQVRAPLGAPLWSWPKPRGEEQFPWEPRRTLDKATRYTGTFKRERLHANGNAVVPAMGYAVGVRLRARLAGAPATRGPVVMPPAASSKAKGYWPTAVTTDAKGARRETARTESWTSNPGTTLTDAVWLSRPDDYGRPLNPDWVDALMGFPVGWSLPADQAEAARQAYRRDAEYAR